MMLRVYVLVCFLFVCVFMSKFVLDEELFLWKMRSEREGNIRGNMYSFGSSSSGVSQNVFVEEKRKRNSRAHLLKAHLERESFECNAKLDLAIQY